MAKILAMDDEEEIRKILKKALEKERHIKNIRAKLKKHDEEPIETVWGIGYRWSGISDC